LRRDVRFEFLNDRQEFITQAPCRIFASARRTAVLESSQPCDTVMIQSGVATTGGWVFMEQAKGGATRLQVIALLGAGLTLACANAVQAQTEDELSALLKRQTQEFSDAGQQGDKAVLDQYLDPSVMFTEEDGSVVTKKDILDGAAPPPKGVQEKIVVTEWVVRRFGAVAVTAFVDDQTEDFHGQTLHFKYRSTEAWRLDHGHWRMIASQTLALQQDPPAAKLEAALLDQYVGTYKVGADLVYTISRQGDHLTGAVNGGPPVMLEAELPDVLFTPGRPRIRRIFKRDDSGRVTGYVSRREGRDVMFTKSS